MPTPLINLIGCGRLGRTIGRLIVQKNVGKIGGVMNTTYENALKAVQFVGQGQPCEQLRQLPAADISLITTRDDVIEKVCKQLILDNKKIAKGSIIAHCSGSLTAQILVAAKERDCLTASVHPIKSFANPEVSAQKFEGTFCAFEGDKAAFPLLQNIFTGIGGNIITIDSTKKRIYHAAGVIANNYLITLHRRAVDCYMASGIEESVAKSIVSMLMHDAFTNLQTLTHAQALTGPINRGDDKTVKGHMDALKNMQSDRLTRTLYSDLGLATLAITKHSPVVQLALQTALKAEQEKEIEEESNQTNDSSKLPTFHK